MASRFTVAARIGCKALACAALVLAACQREAPPAAPSQQAKAAESAAAENAPPLRAIGTEPFWGVDIDGLRLRYTTPEDSAGRVFDTRRVAQAGGWRWSAAGDAIGFDLAITPGECSDGMSDRRYRYRAQLHVDGRELAGCADVPEAFVGE